MPCPSSKSNTCTSARIGEFTPLGAFRAVLEDAWGGAAPNLWAYAVLAACAVGATTVAARVFRWE